MGDMSSSMSAWRARLASLPRNVWTLQRFGLTPSKLRHRLVDRSAPKVLSVSLPKAGTHLLERALCLHPLLYRKILATVWPEALPRWGSLAGLVGRLSPGQIALAHLPFEPSFPDELGDTRAVFLIRDPRDVVLSEAHYAASRPNHPYHAAYAGCTTLAERVRVAIDGDPRVEFRSIAERLDRYGGWLHGSAFVVRFEDLVGPQGGGSAERQQEAVQGLYAHLGVEADERLVADVCSRLFSGDSPTFRRGAVGQWRTELDEEIVRHFREVVGSRLEDYGYTY